MRFFSTTVFSLFVALAASSAIAAEASAPAPADPAAESDWMDRDWMDQGKLLATGGVSTVEGAGGGGIATWSLITGYGTRDSLGGNAHYTFVTTDDYQLHTAGVALGLFDRVELSYAKQWFDTQDVGAALGLGEGWTIHQDIFGVKVKLIGDAVYDQDSFLPQISIGAQYKKNDRSAVLAAIGARDDDGIDYYLAATKVLLDQSLLLDGTLRLTKANQLGLLGFGGDLNNDYELQFEGSAAYLFSRNFAAGVELRTKPDNLGFADEDDWYDIFVAWFPTKNISVTAAYTDLGNITIEDDQDGAYISLQAGF